MASNLPPGVLSADIPGNRPEDIAWEELHDRIDKDADDNGMDLDDIQVAWMIGLAAYLKAREIGAINWDRYLCLGES